METRHHSRYPVDIQGRYRIGNGIWKDVTVNDLSIHGCRMFDRFSKLERSDFVYIKIGSIGPIDAHVRWRRHNDIGIEFSGPLHPSVLEHMWTTMGGWSSP